MARPSFGGSSPLNAKRKNSGKFSSQVKTTHEARLLKNQRNRVGRGREGERGCEGCLRRGGSGRLRKGGEHGGQRRELKRERRIGRRNREGGSGWECKARW
ncbi:hypothetical protein Droror1_Dr00027853 [Drosera rotundifolia]